MLSAIHERAPALYPLAHAMYSSASPLLCRQGLASDPLAVLSSACGSRHGDVLGTACMAMPLQGPIEEVNQTFGGEGVSCTNISDNAIFMGPRGPRL
jgi:hypothetical protein